MKIDEAIKLQSDLLDLLPEVGFNKYTAATQLGIEALKFFRYFKLGWKFRRNHKLPGETEE